MARRAVLDKVAAAARDLANALAELAHQSQVADEQDDYYDSVHLPPRTTRRRFAEVCRSGCVPGAYREGKNWVCLRESWRSSRLGQSVSEEHVSGPSLGERAAALLNRSGLRLLPGSNGSRSNEAR